jgi:hypothetical protein
MPVQDENGRIGFFEDFIGAPAASTISDATAGTRWNAVTLVAISGDVAMDHTVDESGGVASFSGAAGAADGVAILGTPMRPSTNGMITAGGRFKASAVTDYRVFLGLQQTISLSETVNPFTLSGTTLTANNGGETVGFYYDTQATTDDFRFMASSAGVADTAARVKVGDAAKGVGSQSTTTTLGSLGIRAGVTPAADTYIVWKIELDPDGTCRGWIGDESMAKTHGLNLIATLLPGTLSTTAFYWAHMHLAEQSTGDPTHEVDYFYQYGYRDWDGTQP